MLDSQLMRHLRKLEKSLEEAIGSLEKAVQKAEKIESTKEEAQALIKKQQKQKDRALQDRPHRGNRNKNR